MSLKEFARRLRALKCEGRPFVCDGSPLRCTAFIVGLNPTTGDFWPFWNDSYGFDMRAWFGSYQKERLKRGMKRGIGPSRINMNKVAQSAKPIQCLDTNVYEFASRGIEDLPSSCRRTDVFKFLLETIKPKALLLHGTDARKEVGRILGVNGFKTISFAPIVANGRRIMVCATRHARFWSHAEAEVLGRKLREALKHPSARRGPSSGKTEPNVREPTSTREFRAGVSDAAKDMLIVAGYNRDTPYRNRIFCAGGRVRIGRTNTSTPTLRLVGVSPKLLHLDVKQWRVNSTGTRWRYTGDQPLAALRVALGKLSPRQAN